MKTLTSKTAQTLPQGWNVVLIESVRFGESLNNESIEMKLTNMNGQFTIAISTDEIDDDLIKTANAIQIPISEIIEMPKSLLNKIILVKVDFDGFVEENFITDIKPVLNNQLLENLLININ